MIFTKDEVLNAAKKAEITVIQTPKGKNPAFVSSDGNRYPIADTTSDESGEIKK